MSEKKSILRFAEYTLDRADRQVCRDGAPLDLGSRYFDALVLLVEARGGLVSKDRFMEEVWRGIPVTDEALTQCIRTLRRALGDDAANPRFIQTVPKHGYRFLSDVEFVGEPVSGGEENAEIPRAPGPGRLAAASTLGGAATGVVGGLFYGIAAASGGASTMVVLAALVALLGTLAGAGIGLGMASALAWRGRADGVLIPGAMLGGMAVGALGGTLGKDGVGLLTSQSIGAVAGLVEGLIMGGAIGAALWLAWRRRSGLAAAAILALAIGGSGGLLVDLVGGRLLGGSLRALQLGLGDTRLHLETLGAVFGESGFGPRTLMAATVTEGAILAATTVCAVMLAFRGRRGPR
ncbi:MAG: transcriptional regulator [Erythrobacter sp.]|nr:transcriptional regulator [Erythrobacter sp.]